MTLLVDGYLIHSISRAAERYGLQIDAGEYTALSARIASCTPADPQDCSFLCKAAGGRQKWAVWYKGEWIPMVFDPEQARIVTILPKHELRPFLRKLPW